VSHVFGFRNTGAIAALKRSSVAGLDVLVADTRRYRVRPEIGLNGVGAESSKLSVLSHLVSQLSDGVLLDRLCPSIGHRAGQASPRGETFPDRRHTPALPLAPVPTRRRPGGLRGRAQRRWRPLVRWRGRRRRQQCQRERSRRPPRASPSPGRLWALGPSPRRCVISTSGASDFWRSGEHLLATPSRFDGAVLLQRTFGLAQRPRTRPRRAGQRRAAPPSDHRSISAAASAVSTLSKNTRSRITAHRARRCSSRPSG
jgi:hypothetical protein